MKNMELWDRVKRTDPAHTKRVEQRGGFTAIDAHSQIEAATREFGPAGGLWWWNAIPTMINDLVVMRVELHHPHGEHPIVQYGCKALVNGSRADDDAYKKAVTDGLTKCLSYLGFNADVFLGKFDDNKYVAQMREEFKSASKAERKAPPDETIARVDAAQIEKITELAGKLKGDGAAAYVSGILKRKKIASLEDVPAADGMQWIMTMSDQIKKEEG